MRIGKSLLSQPKLLDAEFYPMKRGEMKPDEAMRYVEKKMSA